MSQDYILSLYTGGKVVVSADETERIVYGEVDLSEVDRVRSQIPVTAQKRWDLYSITDRT